MSRFGNDYEGDGEFNPWTGWRGRAMSGRQTNASLKEFLAHLDAMPVKRIAFAALKDPETGDHCSVGEFAKMRGVPDDVIEDFAKEVADEGDYYDHQEGPTVTIGRQAGLPMTIAFELAHFNDTLEYDWVEVDGPPPRMQQRQARDGRYQHHANLPISPEERWRRVRARVVELIAESDRSVEYAAKRRSQQKDVAHTSRRGRPKGGEKALA